MGINILHPNFSAEEFKGRTTKRSFVDPEVISTPTSNLTNNFTTQNYSQLNTEGWKIISYPFPYPMNVREFLSQLIYPNITSPPNDLDIGEYVQIIKNNEADIYWPEFSFNGIGDLIPGEGYQIRMHEAVSGFKYFPVETSFNTTPAADLNNLFA